MALAVSLRVAFRVAWLSVVERYRGPVVGLREMTPTVFVALGPSQN